MKKLNKCVVVIADNEDLINWCNRVLGSEFAIIWTKSPKDFDFSVLPTALLTDSKPKKFAPIYETFQVKHKIKCFCITTKKDFPDEERRRFFKAKFIEPNDDFNLNISIQSTYKLSSLSSKDLELFEYNRKLDCAAHSDETVLILGEIGTGKTFAANFIHSNSKRKNKSMVRFTLAESNQNTVEGDLFGVVKNTYTGVEAKDGLLMQAQGGTIFFDDVTELPLEIQVKLLAVLSERKFRQKGGHKEISFTGRFIFATNKDIDAQVRLGRFREDLYSRINVLRLKVPTLNQQIHEIAKYAILYAREKRKSLSKAVIRKLESYDWKWSFRQLRNIVVRACTFAPGDVVQLGDLSFE